MPVRKVIPTKQFSMGAITTMRLEPAPTIAPTMGDLSARSERDGMLRSESHAQAVLSHYSNFVKADERQRVLASQMTQRQIKNRTTNARMSRILIGAVCVGMLLYSLKTLTA
jgi:hypothetical protein